MPAVCTARTRLLLLVVLRRRLGNFERLDGVLLSVLHAVVGDGVPPLLRFEVGAAVDVVGILDGVSSEFGVMASPPAEAAFTKVVIATPAPVHQRCFFFPENQNAPGTVHPLVTGNAKEIDAVVL